MPVDPASPPTGNADVRQAQRFASLERRLARLEADLQGGMAAQVPVVDSLPTAGRKGRVRYLTADNKLYVDNGTSWVAQT